MRTLKTTPRAVAVVGLLLTARCEVAWMNRKPCFQNTGGRTEWCWPCTMRWAMREDAAKFVSPLQDVVRPAAARGRRS